MRDGEEEGWRQKLWSGEDHPEGEEQREEDKGTELGTTLLALYVSCWTSTSIDEP